MANANTIEQIKELLSQLVQWVQDVLNLIKNNI